MASKTKISWTEKTWNPVMGCTKVSAGCKNCYALNMISRFEGSKGWPDRGEVGVTLFPDRIGAPSKWKNPSNIFVCSMSDLFHDDVPDSLIYDVYEEMMYGDGSRHVYQILTKRPERMRDIVGRLDELDFMRHKVNLWHGVTVENTDNLWRIDVLREISVVNKFVSFEPLIGPVHPGLEGINMAVVGGESGAAARTMDLTWVSDILGAANTAGCGFYFKQMGSVLSAKLGFKGAGTNPSDWPGWLAKKHTWL